MYQDVFSSMQSYKLQECKDVFEKKTGLKYQNFLIDQYITQNKTRQNVSEMLGMPFLTVVVHLRELNIVKVNKKNVDGVMNKTPTQIEEETGRPLIEIYNELSEQGHSLTEIAMMLKLSHVTSLAAYIQRYNRKLEQSNLNKDELIFNGELIGMKLSRIREVFIEKLGVEYQEWLKQKYIDEGLSPYDISLITGIKNVTQVSHLKYFSITKTKDQAVQDALKQGTFRPHETIKKARKTMQKKSISGEGSNAQSLFINLLKHYLTEHTIDFKGIEIITGYNEYSILHEYEIDIPIIIFYNAKVYKIAIEYDGDVWHENNHRDDIKNKLLIERGWKLFRIEGNNKTSVNMNAVEEDVKKLVNDVCEYIKI